MSVLILLIIADDIPGLEPMRSYLVRLAIVTDREEIHDESDEDSRRSYPILLE